jgi:hypothetical protein
MKIGLASLVKLLYRTEVKIKTASLGTTSLFVQIAGGVGARPHAK